jgi:phosphoglycolate phosphatase
VIRAVLFDFDLTLADSTRGAVDCVNHALRNMGLSQADSGQIKKTVGLSLPRIFNALTGVSESAKEEQFSRLFIQRADHVMVDQTVMFPQVPDVLDVLRSRGFRTAIVSTKFRHRIQSILARDGIDGSFDVIVGGEDVARHKPDPEGLHYALEALNVNAEHAVYVGDHPVDAEAAEHAGLRFVAVLSGGASPIDFDGRDRIAMLSSLTELPACLNDVLDS